MKFTRTHNSPSELVEKFNKIRSVDMELAADIIEDVLRSDGIDLSEEERSILDSAYDVLWNNAPHVQEGMKQKFLKESYNRGDILNIISTLEDIAYWDTNNRCELSKEDLQKIFDVIKVLKGIPSYLPFEESLKESKNQKVRLHVEYYPYERYGGSDGLKKGNISGVDKLDALKKLTDHMGLYIDSEVIEEEGYSFEDAINQIVMSNGDGCDFIVVLQDRDTGEIYFSENYEDEEDWDDEDWEGLRQAQMEDGMYQDDDPSLEESSEVNLSDKRTSISGILLNNKDKIDSASSQADLVRVCSDILSDKGGAKAQQFLSVLKSKKNHPAALKYVYDFILAGEGMRSLDSKRKSRSVQRREAIQRGESIDNI